MPETSTPGQVAYQVYWQRRIGGQHHWRYVLPEEQAAWEAAAAAVLAQWQQEQARLGAPGWLVEGPSAP